MVYLLIKCFCSTNNFHINKSENDKSEIKTFDSYSFRHVLGSPTKEAYVNITKEHLAANENAYDIYDTNYRTNQTQNIADDDDNRNEVSLEQDDPTKCPFTGLPAAHLKILNSPKCGLLSRNVKKILFGQLKDYYAGILNGWLLLYSSKSNDMKPSDYLFIKGISDIDKSERKKNSCGGHKFTIVMNSGKCHEFLAPTYNEMAEWVTIIKKLSIKDDPSSIEQVTQQQFRELPSLPRSSFENYYSVDCAIDSNVNLCNQYDDDNDSTPIKREEERLYEEPCTSPILTEANVSYKKYNEEQNQSMPPRLPIKKGCSSTIIDDSYQYDVPKPAIAVAAGEVDICKSKISKMTVVLQQNVSLVSPGDINKSSNPKKHIIESHKVSISSKSPVKNWFLKQINKSTERQKQKRFGKNEKNFLSDDSIIKETIGVKGSKVNMIINQMENNGHLRILSHSLKNRKSSVYDEEYEPVVVRNN